MRCSEALRCATFRTALSASGLRVVPARCAAVTPHRPWASGRGTQWSPTVRNARTNGRPSPSHDRLLPMSAEIDQLAMVHRLPSARIVDRIEYLAELAAGKYVVHVGFADAGCREMQAGAGTWLHDRLATRAGSLIGLDVDEDGVQAGARGRLRRQARRLSRPTSRRGARPRARRPRRRRRSDRTSRFAGLVPRRGRAAGPTGRSGRVDDTEREWPRKRARRARRLRGQPPRSRRTVQLSHARGVARTPRLVGRRDPHVRPEGQGERRSITTGADAQGRGARGCDGSNWPPAVSAVRSPPTASSWSRERAA